MARARALVVDGSSTVGDTVSTLETRLDEVAVADSLSAAQARVRDRRPDVVVTEYKLPDGDGLELVRELGSIAELLPVVVYTAHGSEAVASRCLDADVAAYIPKGGDDAAERLGATVEELVTTRHSGAPAEISEPSPSDIVRAVDEAPVGITLSNPSLPDNPLVYANEGYAELTGYDTEAILGRNCRFLQGPDTDRERVAELSEAVDDERPVSVEMLNYREDGTPFWNRVTLAPLSQNGEVTHFVGFQQDVTERKRAEALARQRADALREERQAIERVLGRVSNLVNEVSHALVAASDRREIETQVCETIATTEGYSHAWMAESQVAGGMTVRASKGTTRVESGSSAAFEGTVFERALDTEQVIVPTAEDSVPQSVAPERFDAAEMAVVPLTYRRTTYGVLCVYAERAELLDRRECEVFEAVGQMVASGLNAVETKQVLTADRVTELGVEIAGSDFPLVDLATRTDSTVSYDGSTVGQDGAVRLFVTLSDPDGEVEKQLTDPPGITDGYVIARHNGEVAVSVALADGHAFGELAEYGATLQDMSVSGRSGTAQLHLELPVEGDVRSVLSVLEDAYDGVNLVRQREREREPESTTTFTTAVADRLTERQYTALETAFYSNYFEFPRPVSGEELADSMDISRQTYHQHLRTAQGKLLAEFFESN